MKTLLMHTPTNSATIYLGEDALQRLSCLTQGQRNFVLTDSNVHALYPHIFETYFSDAEIYVLPAGEEYKTFQSLYGILTKMAGAGMHRNSRLFAVGGGLATLPFLYQMAEKYPQYAFDVHKGYGTKAHYAAISEYGTCPIHRTTFLKKFYGTK